ncbi:PSP1 C-terminal conserved region family protein [Histomonas meleagridis]|uniref:PSP1 C-terminal conserved region family protein n=1 Tax=Histomonas meleagridis TaxID=135588 RepID=UPI0035596657|nr:PSP1 C-terminal conserved region family protein [Histomonas meleagridis]KAH0801437.1 PSP1 C-terminal conserved region family protein [Histomonas meleagridis]
MSSNWEDFTNDEDVDINPNMPSLLPSSLRDVWEDPDSQTSIFSESPKNPINYNLGSPRYDHRQPNYVGSAPIHNGFSQNQIKFQGEIQTENKLYGNQCYQVEFHPSRSAWFYAPQKCKFNIGDYVLTEADRGYDIGKVVNIKKRPSVTDSRAKMIVRIAHEHEISQLPQKAESEKRALDLCRVKAAELGLPMEITGAEFQFDGKKLTFYYTASSYIDFRVLVRTLFKVFGTRIWMCCTSEINK